MIYTYDYVYIYIYIHILQYVTYETLKEPGGHRKKHILPHCQVLQVCDELGIETAPAEAEPTVPPAMTEIYHL